MADTRGEKLAFRYGGRVFNILSLLLGGLGWCATAVFFRTKAAKISMDEDAHIVTALMIVCAVGVALNAMLFIRQAYGKRVEFDRSARTISISRLYSDKTVMSFESVERVAPIAVRTWCATRAA
jgi:hypothetical protein